MTGENYKELRFKKNEVKRIIVGMQDQQYSLMLAGDDGVYFMSDRTDSTDQAFAEGLTFYHGLFSLVSLALFTFLFCCACYVLVYLIEPPLAFLLCRLSPAISTGLGNTNQYLLCHASGWNPLGKPHDLAGNRWETECLRPSLD